MPVITINHPALVSEWTGIDPNDGNLMVGFAPQVKRYVNPTTERTVAHRWTDSSPLRDAFLFYGKIGNGISVHVGTVVFHPGALIIRTAQHLWSPRVGQLGERGSNSSLVIDMEYLRAEFAGLFNLTEGRALCPTMGFIARCGIVRIYNETLQHRAVRYE